MTAGCGSRALAHEQPRLPITSELEQARGEPPVMTTTRQDDRPASRQRNLPSMSMAAECEIELLGPDVLEADRGVHEKKAGPFRTKECGPRIGTAGCRIVEAADPDVVERHGQASALIDQNADSRGFERGGHHAIIRPKIVVAQHGVHSTGRSKPGQQWHENRDMPLMMEHEITTQEHHMRLDCPDRLDGCGQEPWIGAGACV